MWSNPPGADSSLSVLSGIFHPLPLCTCASTLQLFHFSWILKSTVTSCQKVARIWGHESAQVAAVNVKKHYCIPPPWAWDPVKNRIPAYKTTHALGFPLRSQLLFPSFTWAAVGFPAGRLLRPPHFVLLAGHSTGGICHMNASGHQFRVISRGGSLLLPLSFLSSSDTRQTHGWVCCLLPRLDRTLWEIVLRIIC